MAHHPHASLGHLFLRADLHETLLRHGVHLLGFRHRVEALPEGPAGPADPVVPHGPVDPPACVGGGGPARGGPAPRPRHIGCMSVPMFSTSVITPTTNTRFTRAPSGVTRYDGARSPPPFISRVASLYSDAKRRHATSRIIRTPPGPRASPAPPPARPPRASSPAPR